MKNVNLFLLLGAFFLIGMLVVVRLNVDAAGYYALLYAAFSGLVYYFSTPGMQKRLCKRHPSKSESSPDIASTSSILVNLCCDRLTAHKAKLYLLKAKRHALEKSIREFAEELINANLSPEQRHLHEATLASLRENDAILEPTIVAAERLEALLYRQFCDAAALSDNARRVGKLHKLCDFGAEMDALIAR